MIRVTDQYVWNFVFLLFFLGLVTMGTIILETESRIPLAELSLTDYALIALATYRFIRLMVNDTITKFFREQFWDVKEVRGKILLVKPESGPRRTIADLLSCTWCFGAWAAATVTFFYLLTPYAVFPIMIMALSGVGSWLHQFAQLTCYKADRAKHESESL